VRAEIIFARKELASLVAGLDADHDGALTQAEIDAGRDSIQGATVGRIKVTGDGAPCAGTLAGVELTEQDGVLVRSRHRCGKRPQQATVTLALLEDLSFGHRHLARAHSAAGPIDLVLQQRLPSVTFSLPPDTAPAAAAGASAISLFRRGALHVATAWPLPVFLLGLLARSASRRAAVLAAGAFALALAVGLVLATAGLFLPSPHAIALAVAASLAYVGVDNLSREERGPWIALPFGLVHGFGGAVAFRVSGAPPGALAGFAAGALLAVAAFATAIVPAVRWAGGRVTLALSALVAAAGVAALALAFRT
jgi:hypothetical protein